MAIALDATASGTNGGANLATYSKTIAHTLGGGSNRAVVVCTGVRYNGAPGTASLAVPTYNGTNMTLACAVQNASIRNICAIYYLLDASLPAAGTYNVVVSATSSSATTSNVCGEMYSLTGVKQSAQPDATATYADDTGGTSISKNIVTVANNSWIIDALCTTGNTQVSATAAGSQANPLVVPAGLANAQYDSSTLLVPTAGSTATGWGSFTTANPTRWAYCQASFAPAASATPTGLFLPFLSQ